MFIEACRSFPMIRDGIVILPTPPVNMLFCKLNVTGGGSEPGICAAIIVAVTVYGPSAPFAVMIGE